VGAKPSELTINRVTTSVGLAVIHVFTLARYDASVPPLPKSYARMSGFPDEYITKRATHAAGMAELNNARLVVGLHLN
jgi:hypothetical protein